MARRAYPTDLTDDEWEQLAPHLPDEGPRGRPRKHRVREILDAIFYTARGGCAWRLLPHGFPPWGTVYYWFRRWRLKTASGGASWWLCVGSPDRRQAETRNLQPLS